MCKCRGWKRVWLLERWKDGTGEMGGDEERMVDLQYGEDAVSYRYVESKSGDGSELQEVV